ncbi:methyl-accepting chemotaxis protein [Salidesulfovibrio onnuriiensis]|uniref:methyl-accepting chemotaxis protein n=1 Tax=Salidesulfovibrio onnuriiensis TaxID=2583823 RepID=UPI0011CC1003|nr:Cache 3/Cache 2 fusion domain-containing protein [Salidesulfovibrio onnuriiensis]
MSRLLKLPFQTKLLAGTVCIVAAAILTMTLVTQFQVKDSLTEMGRTSMQSFGESMYNLMEMQHSLLADKVKTDLNLMQKEMAKYGSPFINAGNSVTMDIVNQVTKEKENVTIPTMQFGGHVISGTYDFVDMIQKQVGGTATIFQLLPGKLLRISTNVLKTDGQRAVGTYIPDSSPVYKSIMNGETYYGIAFVVNDWYQTAYMPLKDAFGKIVGVIYVGRKILTPEFRKAVEAAKIGGKGYGFIFNQKGGLVLHPSLEGESLVEYPFWELFKSIKDGYATYEFKGQDKQVFIKYFEPWGWSYGFSMTGNEIFNGVDRKLLLSNITVAVLSLVAVVGVLLLLIRVVTKPLHELSAFTGEVSHGNFDAEISYDVRDAIGDTIESVRDMILELKNKLGFSEGILRSLTYPCVVVDTEERISFVNQQELDLLQKDGIPGDYMGMSFSEFVYGDPGRETQMGKCIKDRCVIVGQETHGQGAKGREYDILVDMAVLEDLDGKVIGAFTIVTETTAIKANERLANEQRERIVQAARSADEIAEQLSSAAEELSAQVEQSSKGTGVQRERAAETATAMEEMNATVLEVARNAADAAANADEARVKAGTGAELVDKVVEAIAQVDARSAELKDSMDALGRQTESIGAIMQVIEDIADQTNLLALNAAIEAARAGEAGRGFAVVADEVRKLAEKTMDATKQVGQAITDIQDGAMRNVEATEVARESVRTSTELANQSGEAMEEIRSLVEQSADQVRNIATAAEQQSATSEEVNRATEEINVISAETATAMQESQNAIESLSQLAGQLKELIERMQEA